MVLGDYYVKNYARKDKLTGDLIPFKNYKQYFRTYFLNSDNMLKWCDAAPKAEVKKDSEWEKEEPKTKKVE